MTEISPVKRSDGLLTVELGPSIKAQWVQWCKERNLLPGKAIKRLVDNAMANGPELAASANAAQVKVKVVPSAIAALRSAKRFTSA